jgi:enoyl-CoA hydratase
MSYEFVVSEREDTIATLRLNRPEKLNSWNLQMREELREAVRELVDDDELRVLIITGTGRAFSAGEDVHGMGDLSSIGPKGFRRRVRMIHNVFDELEKIEVPVIAAINGVAAGGGLELALSCDFRIATEGATLGLPEGNVGLIPGSGGISRLVKLVGPAIAKRLVMTGEMISAKKALEYGLVEEVVSSQALINHCDTLARTLAERAPLALGSAKLVINQCMNVDTETGRNFERITQSVLKLTSDHEEGAKSFIEKRKPNFSGR